jgi:hypothetical protein
MGIYNYPAKYGHQRAFGGIGDFYRFMASVSAIFTDKITRYILVFSGNNTRTKIQKCTGWKNGEIEAETKDFITKS